MADYLRSVPRPGYSLPGGHHHYLHADSGLFQSGTPLHRDVLQPFPLSLIGIILGHWIMGAYFSATSMIGFIALAGVMVRNSLLLIDFINIRLKEGVPIKQAIIESGLYAAYPLSLRLVRWLSVRL